MGVVWERKGGERKGTGVARIDKKRIGILEGVKKIEWGNREK